MIITGHALVQNVRRGHHELAVVAVVRTRPEPSGNKDYVLVRRHDHGTGLVANPLPPAQQPGQPPDALDLSGPGSS